MTDDEDAEAGDEDPLEDLERDKEAFERERLRDALQGVIEIDKATGAPIFLERFQQRTNKEKFVSLLLYRAALVKLGHVDEEAQAEDAEDFALDLPVAASTVKGYARDLDFVEADDGYYVPDRLIPDAIDFLP